MSIFIYPPISSAAGGATAANQTTMINLLTDIEANGNLNVVDFLDTPLHVASSVNIPASSGTPVTVVASLAAAIKAVHVQDTTGSFIGIYSDPAGTPVLEAIINPGSDSIIPLILSASTVIGLRNMENSAISSGNVAINFLG